MCSDGLMFEEVRPALESALDAGAWLVLGGHEIGDHVGAETTLRATLGSVVEWCHANHIWIDTVADVAGRVQVLQQAVQARSA